MTTKEQEFKALEKIRKIVSELGEDSYIAAAFEGCFEIAEDNIKNDFACSMKQRAESAEKKAEAIAITNRDLEAQLDRMKDVRKYEAEKADAAIAALQERIAKAEKRAVSPWLYREIWLHYTDAIQIDAANMARYADVMSDLAEAPTDIAFVNAVKNYRKTKERKETAEQVIRALEQLDPEK